MTGSERWIRNELAKLAKRVDDAISSGEPYKRDPKLDELFERSRAHKMTLREYREQTINWIWGQAVDLPEKLRPTIEEVRLQVESPHLFLHPH